jgi:hypothetical protein
MYTMRLPLTLCFLSLITFTPRVAWADYKQDLIQITCNKTLDYFSLRTVQIIDGTYVDNNDKEKRSRDSGAFFDLHELQTTPYSCDMGDGVISVEVTDYIPPHATGECGGLGGFNLQFRRNRQAVYKFSAFAGCPEQDNHLIEMWSSYGLRDCTISDTPDHTQCAYHALSTSTNTVSHNPSGPRFGQHSQPPK